MVQGIKPSLVCFLGLFAAVLSLPSFPKCKTEDSACLGSSAQSALKQILAGVPELGIESSDPLYLDLVQGDIANLKYDFSKSTLKGYKDCEIKNVKLDVEKNDLDFDLYCPFDMNGQYVLSGRLLILPIEGNGAFTMKAKRIHLSVKSELKQTQKDGKTYIGIKKFNFEVAAEDRVLFEFKNLFNGNKELAEGVRNFANESYKEVTKELSGPLFNAGLKKVIKNVNKYLKSVPLEDLIIS